MLYISRLIRHKSVDKLGLVNWLAYGVVDSDDGVETIVPAHDLAAIISNTGLEIHGVNRKDPSLSEVRPFTANSLPIQAKAKLVKGITVATYKEYVTEISPDRKIITKPTELRVSDFGTKVADFVLNIRESLMKPCLTIILDDKITEVGQRAFRLSTFMAREQVYLFDNEGTGGGWLGLKFDLQELSNGPIVKSVYSQLFAYAGHPERGIIDNPARLKAMLSRKHSLVSEVSDSCYT